MSLTGYLTVGGSDLSSVFMNINRGISLTSTNVFQQQNTFLGNVDLSGSLLYGRNGGSNFNTGGSPYPVGYTNVYTTASAAVSTLADFSPTFIMSPGVWLITIQVSFTNITNWNISSPFVSLYIPAQASNPANCISFINNKNGFIQHMPPNSTIFTPIVNTSFIIIVSVSCRIICNISASANGTPYAIVQGGMTKLA